MCEENNRTGSQVKPAGLPGLEIFKLGLEVETGRFYARPGPVLLTVVCHALPLSGQKYKPIDPSLREPTTGRGRQAREELDVRQSSRPVVRLASHTHGTTAREWDTSTRQGGAFLNLMLQPAPAT
jgi:hypothetical protein